MPLPFECVPELFKRRTVSIGELRRPTLQLIAGPGLRRTMQTATAGGDEMDSVRNYFNGTGFERWNKIYGETDEVNKVRL